MIDLSNPDSLQIILYLIVPGLVASFFRAQLLTGRMQKPSEAILSYTAISLTYWAMIMIVGIPTAYIIDSPTLSVLFVLVGPAALGLALGLNAKHDGVRNLLRRVGVSSVHPFPTAWDWKFNQKGSRHVIVYLNDGKKVGGLYSSNSFTSSDPSERDIFLEKVYRVSQDGPWDEIPGCEILIRPNEVRYIEFFKFATGAKNE